MSTIRILLIDSETLVRKALAALLASYLRMEVLEDFSDAATALACQSTAPPDLILMELTRTGLKGATAVRRLSEKWPGCRFAFLTGRVDAGSIAEWKRSRAHGYISKASSTDELVLAIDMIMNGSTYIHSSMSEALKSSSRGPYLAFRSGA